MGALNTYFQNQNTLVEETKGLLGSTQLLQEYGEYKRGGTKDVEFPQQMIGQYLSIYCNRE